MLVTDARRQKLTALEGRMERALDRRMQDGRSRLDALSRVLDSLNPGSVLERGYAAVYLDGRAVGSAKEAPVGSRIEIRMRDGRLQAEVSGAEAGDE